MGSYTMVIENNHKPVKIIYMEGLKEFLRKARKGEYKGYEKDDAQLYPNAVEITEDGELDFGGMDGWKIISYWYEEMVMFLRDVAVFVEGEVLLEYESNEKAGFIVFKNGLCEIHAGHMQYDIFSPEQMRHGIPKMEKELKNILVARRL